MTVAKSAKKVRRRKSRWDQSVGALGCLGRGEVRREERRSRSAVRASWNGVGLLKVSGRGVVGQA